MRCAIFITILGADDETRTRDPRITNALLYQLSHIGLFAGAKVVKIFELRKVSRKIFRFYAFLI